MRVVLQRVRSASVTVENAVTGQIGTGLLILVGIGPEDDERDLALMTEKVRNLRIFEDAEGKMNRSALDLRDVGEDVGLLVVSQFTLYGDVRKGRRPSFVSAAPPDKASAMVERFADLLAEGGMTVQQGIFGAEMLVALENDGPVTIWIDSADLRGPRRS